MVCWWKEIIDYRNNFEQLHQKLKNIKIELQWAVLVYRLLKNANFSYTTQNFNLDTVSSLTFGNMKKQLKAIYNLCCISESVNLENAIQFSNEVLISKRSEKHSNSNNCGWNRQKPPWPWWSTTTMLYLKLNYASCQ